MTERALVPTLFVASMLLIGSAFPALAADFKIDAETDVAKILDVIGVMGRFNVVVAPSIRQRLTFSESGVDPVDAMHHVAKRLDLTVVPVKNASKIDTYLVVPKDQTAKVDISEPGPDESYADFTIKMETPVDKIVETVALLGKLRVQVDPSVNVKMTLHLSQVRPLAAIRLIAAVCGLAVETTGDPVSPTHLVKPAAGR